MIPIAGLIQIGLSFFEIDVDITDFVYTTTDGEDVREVDDTRTIQGAVDPSNSKVMERIFGSSMSAGDIMIITTAELYILDTFETGSSTDEERKQSIVTYGGRPYRVSNSGEWPEQVGVNVYLCKRHQPQDGL